MTANFTNYQLDEQTTIFKFYNLTKKNETSIKKDCYHVRLQRYAFNETIFPRYKLQEMWNFISFPVFNYLLN